MCIGLGSNLGDSRQTLAGAIDRIRTSIRLMRVSSLFETAPVGVEDQPVFLNAAVLCESSMTPLELLANLHEIERHFGRNRDDEQRYGPRTLDLDILLSDGLAVQEPGLEIPHRRLTERRFAMEPLIEVWPDAALPDGTRLLTKWAEVADQVSVKRHGPGWYLPG